MADSLWNHHFHPDLLLLLVNGCGKKSRQMPTCGASQTFAHTEVFVIWETISNGLHSFDSANFRLNRAKKVIVMKLIIRSRSANHPGYSDTALFRSVRLSVRHLHRRTPPILVTLEGTTVCCVESH